MYMFPNVLSTLFSMCVSMLKFKSVLEVILKIGGSVSIFQNVACTCIEFYFTSMNTYDLHIFLIDNFVSFTVFYSMKSILHKQYGIVENYPYCNYKYAVGLYSSHVFRIKLRTSKRAR